MTIRSGWIEYIKECKKDFCWSCGYKKHFSVIEFHHVDPAKKEITIGKLTRLKFSVERAAELDKCIPLCSNCHKEIHIKEGKRGRYQGIAKRKVIARRKTIKKEKNIGVFHGPFRPVGRPIGFPVYSDEVFDEIMSAGESLN